MVSIFLFALLTDRAYLAHWQDGNPIPLEVLFEKPHIDWSYDPDELRELFDKKNHRFLSYQPLNTLNEHWGPIGRLMFPDGPAQDFNNLWNASVSREPRYYLDMLTDELEVYRMAIKPSLCDSYFPRVEHLSWATCTHGAPQGKRLPLHYGLFIPTNHRLATIHQRL